MLPLLPDLEDLPLPTLVAQMLVVRASGHLFDHQIQYPAWEPPAATLRSWLVDLGVGGVILLGGTAAEIGLRTQQLQSWATIPLLLAADIEEGVGQRFSGATWFPPPMALAAIARQNPALAADYAHQMGAHTAAEALAIGLNWVLAPVVDVNNNPDNPVINVRAFGENTGEVSQLTTAFIEGAQTHPVLTAAKHFPGHGDTATDSHLELPLIPHPLERLQAVELPPFQAAIAAGVDSVMSAHLLIPALDPDYPATLSQRILTGELRQNLGFAGLIVTDALVMGAIANRYGLNEAPLMALEAGADILLMPLDPAGAIQAICAAVESGRITVDRIKTSVERIWRAKQKVCSPQLTASSSHAWENQPPPPIQLEQLAQPQTIATARHILQASQTGKGTLAPIAAGDQKGWGRNLIIVDQLLDCDFLDRTAPAVQLPQKYGYRQLTLVDSFTNQLPEEGAHRPAVGAAQPSTLLQLFIRGNPFRGSANLNQTAQRWFEFLLETEQLSALVIYGSPYILEQFLPHLSSNIPYVFTYGQMPLAQEIALNQLMANESSIP
uniref:beta-N-acetylhexosaminidase n=1 Tax=Cyanothece sp. (strain PCC 7425 / ATCC 29141) TaxID=395961 RepID=B8HWS2_CYAP4